MTPSCGRDRRSRPWEPGLEPGPPYSSISLLLGPRPFPPSSSLQGVGPRTPSTHLPPLESCHLLAWNASEAIGPLSVRTEDSVRTGVEMPGGWEEGRETPSPHLIPQRLQLRSPGGQASHRLSALELRSSSLWVDLVVVFAFYSSDSSFTYSWAVTQLPLEECPAQWHSATQSSGKRHMSDFSTACQVFSPGQGTRQTKKATQLKPSCACALLQHPWMLSTKGWWRKQVCLRENRLAFGVPSDVFSPVFLSMVLRDT